MTTDEHAAQAVKLLAITTGTLSIAPTPEQVGIARMHIATTAELAAGQLQGRPLRRVHMGALGAMTTIDSSSSRSGPPQGSGSGAVYGLGMIGAAVYYIRFADGFWDGAFGLLKALVWPAFFVYEALKAFGS